MQESDVIAEGVGLIRDLSGLNGLAFNPQRLVKAVNWLRVRGARPAVRILNSYLSERSREGDPENAVLVARILFATNEGVWPPRLKVGRPDVREPEDPSVFPLFPLALHDDIPFLLTGGYYLGGQPQPPSDYIEWCVHHCHVRATPLAPADDPLQSVDEFLGFDALRALDLEAWHRQMLRSQALRTVSSIYPTTEEDLRDLLAAVESGRSEESWHLHRKNLRALGPAWNPDLNDYEARGTTRESRI